MKYKRYFLPFMSIFFILGIEDVHNYIYIPIIVTCGSFILFWNFPILAYYNSKKPLYVKDLFIDVEKLPNYDVNPKIKKKFLTIFEWSLIISASILMGALSDFWLYKTHGNESWIEIIGITGGILNIFQVIDSIIGSIILSVLRKYIVKESNKFKKENLDNLRRIIQLKINQTRINKSHLACNIKTSLTKCDGNEKIK